MKKLHQFRILIGCVILYLLFHSFFENKISNLIVTPFIQSLDSSLLNDIIFILLFIIGIYLLLRNINRKVKPAIIEVVIVGIFLLFIGYYRCTENIWFFTPFSWNTSIKYVDVFIAYGIILIFSYFVYYCFDRTYTKVSKDGFKYDIPIKGSNQDQLHRTKMATEVANKIKNTANSSSSFAIGICGEWGNGKTSFLNLIEEELESTDRLIIHFNPWLNNDERHVIYAFFDELSSQLKVYNKDLANLILNYGKVLSGIFPDQISSIRNALNSLAIGKKTLRDQFESINKTIQDTGLQLIIIIDDIDRLYGSEIQEIVRLVRNSANFANTVFLISYDRNYLISALKSQNQYKPDVFLDKVFQLELHLPAFEESVKRNIMLKGLDHLLLEEDKRYLEGSINNDLFSNLTFDFSLINNIRDITRLINQFAIDYALLKRETNVIDLLNLALLKNRFSGFYTFFSHNYNIYLARQTVSGESVVILKKRDSESGDTMIAKYIQGNKELLGIHDFDVELIIRYLKNVFPDPDLYKDDLKALSITRPLYLDRYFHMELITGDLSEKEFTEYRQNDSSYFLEYIKKSIGNGYVNQLIYRLSIINLYEDAEDYKKVIKALFELSIYKQDSNYKNSILDIIYEKLMNQDIKQFFDEDSFKLFINDLLRDDKYGAYNLCQLINNILSQNDQYPFLLTELELVEIKYTLYKSYIENIDSINEDFTRLYSLVVYSLDSNNKKHISDKNEDILTLYKEGAKKIPEEYFKHIIIRTISTNIKAFSISRIVFDLWGSFESFRGFVESLPNSIKGKEEFLLFYRECEKVDFQTYVPFDFKVIIFDYESLSHR